MAAPRVELSRDDSAQTSRGAFAARSFIPMPIGSEAGVYRVNFGMLPQGRYRAKVSDARADDPSSRIIFDVKQYDQEEVDLELRGRT